MSTPEQLLSPVDERIIRLVRRELDVDPLYEPEFDLSTLDLTSRKQVRDTNVAPKEQVNAYTWMMDEGDVFPSILVCRDPTDGADPVLNDGNTRAHAHRNRGERWTRAIVIPVDYHGVSDEMRHRIDYVAGALNAKNGRANSKSERDMLIINGVLAGKPDKEIATTAGVNIQTVANARDRALAQSRLEDLGVPRDDLTHLKDTAISKLGKADDIADELFVETVQLANAAGMNAGDVTSLINSVREAGSEGQARERLAREREEWKPRIEEITRGNGGGPKPLAPQLRRSLGFINKNPAAAFADRNADNAFDYVEVLEQAIAKLTEVLNNQREINDELRSRIEAGLEGEQP